MNQSHPCLLLITWQVLLHPRYFNNHPCSWPLTCIPSLDQWTAYRWVLIHQRYMVHHMAVRRFQSLLIGCWVCHSFSREYLSKMHYMPHTQWTLCSSFTAAAGKARFFLLVTTAQWNKPAFSSCIQSTACWWLYLFIYFFFSSQFSSTLPGC